ncbi:hypothetical protein J2Z22_001826 [Paenibacillus forsythiae]|uniref:Uncharacterized protein n=1 Tax=Paenibacillus forsythiae TaxID=365616 RepID=A0ABU3H9D4_9BACL|nr:hypothetical protein [Paenibacillus forsythiae]
MQDQAQHHSLERPNIGRRNPNLCIEIFDDPGICVGLKFMGSSLNILKNLVKAVGFTLKPGILRPKTQSKK